MAKSHITAERLRELVSYDELTGEFRWRFGRPNASAGTLVGSLTERGYVVCGIDYRNYHMHRLAWLYMTGKLPEGEIDHIDRNKSNNAWCNLRSVNRQQNQQNRGACKGNRSGQVGVTWDVVSGKWQARICHDGVRKHLGLFRKIEHAIAARRLAELQHFTHSLSVAQAKARIDLVESH